ncbi:MAG: ABC transporter substrate-binding protein [Pseudomonadota bacterium]|nr:ABC transporter substrate-binding protein [Pseudomonadota bacterium]
MRGTVLLLALTLGACARPPASSGGIVSTNPCADAMLVELVPPAQIAAISHYSQDEAASSIPPEVSRRFRTTAGTAEEVIAMRPDLIVASSMTPAVTRAAYTRAGLTVLTFDSPTTVAASEAQVRRLAAAVGARRQGEAMVGRIEAAVRQVAAIPHTGRDPAALLFIAGDLASGSGTLLDELMRRAGFTNAAAGYGLAFTGALPIETIAAHPPRVVISPGDGRTAALRRRVLARISAPVAEASFPRRLMNCGGPVIVPALARLATIRRQMAT